MSSNRSVDRSSLVVEGYEEISDSGDAASNEGNRPAHAKKTLAEVAQGQQRFVQGGSTKPAPLNYGPSLLEMLNEGPPMEQDKSIPASPPSLPQSPSADLTPHTPTSGKFNKARKLAKRLLTPKHKQLEAAQDPAETGSPSSPSHLPGITRSDEHEASTSTTPTPLGQIYGEPPAYKIRPEHLRLSSFPPVPKEELAKLPRDLEPTLPSGQVSPLGFGHQSQPFSLRNATKVNDAGVDVPVYTECEECEEVVPTKFAKLTSSASQLQARSPTPFPQINAPPTVTANIMRTFDDTFSGEKIYPGKGKIYVRGDSKIFRFQNGKTESLFLQRKNPRRIAWTTLYRRQHKKGISEEVAKKRTRRTVKQQRGIVGASLDIIKERRSQRPEARAAARQEAIKAGKEKKATNESKKKMEKAKSAASAARGQVRANIQSKQGAKGAPSKATGKVR
ncbi:MAG: hypothetical protein LQ346_007552 [Caloplaca aetnensis]|nr:MAG: hypothetical protein LQ346_007552 [Caloplaca aetnensis]